MRQVGIAIITAIALLYAAMMAGMAQAGIKDTKHNLSAPAPGNPYNPGPGPIQSQAVSSGGTTEICVFCHTPHSSTLDAPLWNKSLSIYSYTTYTSDVLAGLGYSLEDPNSGSATGKTAHLKTRICMSCHDGTIAMGTLVNYPQAISSTIPMSNTSGGKMPSTAAGYIGTDLRDSHPIAMKHDPTKDPELKSIDIAENVRLYDTSGRKTKTDGDYVECTSCHDAHDNQYGKFLIESNQYSNLCRACHDKEGYFSIASNESAHANASIGYTPPTGGTGGAPTLLGNTVGEVKCMDCHYPHKAGLSSYGGNAPNPDAGKYLLTYQEEKTCFNNTNRWGQATNVCHGQDIAVGDKKRIEPELSNSSRHNIGNYVNKHKAVEVQATTPNGWFASSVWHVECADCHNPHSAGSALHTQGTNTISSTNALYGVAYVSVSGGYPGGSWTAPTAYTPVEPLGAMNSSTWGPGVKEYEVCFKCHSYFATAGASFPNAYSSIQQMSDQSKEFNETTSFHPVVTSNTNTYGTLINGWDSGTQLMYCSDCHTKEDYSNSNRPKGPHGSANSYLLPAPYYDDKAAAGSGDDLSGTFCLVCHDPSTYSSGAGTNTGFYSTSGTNLHTRHYTVRNNPPSPWTYRCVNCHVRTPHGWDRKGMIHLQGDNISHANGAWYEPVSGPTITGFNGGALPASGSYGPNKGDNCFTINGCHQ